LWLEKAHRRTFHNAKRRRFFKPHLSAVIIELVKEANKGELRIVKNFIGMNNYTTCTYKNIDWHAYFQGN